MIYFVKNPLNDTVKISRSPLPLARVQALSKQCGIDLILLGVIHSDNDKLLEYQLDEEFNYTQLGYGWFVLSDELQAYIDKHAVEYEDPVRKWRTVRVPTNLYDWLGEHKQKTGIPIATAVRKAIHQYKAQEERSQL